jgi:hypothetical protein
VTGPPETGARIPRPSRDDLPASYDEYVALVPGDDAATALAAQPAEAEALLGRLPDERALFRYAPGKWSVKEVVGHLCDSERIFACRALRFGRGDPTPLPNFEEDAYVAAGGFDRRRLRDLLDEFRALRATTLSLYAAFRPEDLRRRGVARGLSMSAGALGWITAGHAAHHLGVLRDRYALGGART